MFEDRRPAQVIGFAAEAVNVVFVEDEDPSGRSELARLVIARVAAGKALAIDPVGAVKPGVVQEAHRSEQVSVFAGVDRCLSSEVARVWSDVVPLAFLIEPLRFHVNVFAVAGENVWKADGHLQRFVTHLQVLAGFGIDLVDDRFGDHAAGSSVEFQEP